MRVLILGASGGCGRHVVTALLRTKQDVFIKALVRSESSLWEALKESWPELGEEERRVSPVVIAGVESLSEADLVEHMRGCDAVFSCLGHHEPGAKGMTAKAIYGPKDQRQVCTDFSRKVCGAARTLGSSEGDSFKLIKYVVISSPFVGGSEGLAGVGDPPVSFCERCVLRLLECLVPPHWDNCTNARFLQTQMQSSGESNAEEQKPFVEICVVRPDNMVNISDAKPGSECAVIGEYKVTETRQYGLFNGGTSSRENVGQFLADLVVGDGAEELWAKYKNKFPQVLDAFQPGQPN